MKLSAGQRTEVILASSPSQRAWQRNYLGASPNEGRQKSGLTISFCDSDAFKDIQMGKVTIRGKSWISSFQIFKET
jgi:hypothetical protein